MRTPDLLFSRRSCLNHYANKAVRWGEGGDGGREMHVHKAWKVSRIFILGSCLACAGDDDGVVENILCSSSQYCGYDSDDGVSVKMSHFIVLLLLILLIYIVCSCCCFLGFFSNVDVFVNILHNCCCFC